MGAKKWNRRMIAEIKAWVDAEIARLVRDEGMPPDLATAIGNAAGNYKVEGDIPPIALLQMADGTTDHTQVPQDLEGVALAQGLYIQLVEEERRRVVSFGWLSDDEIGVLVLTREDCWMATAHIQPRTRAVGPWRVQNLAAQL